MREFVRRVQKHLGRTASARPTMANGISMRLTRVSALLDPGGADVAQRSRLPAQNGEV